MGSSCCFINPSLLSTSGVFRISKRGAKCLLATTAHTKGGQTKFSNFFYDVKKMFFGQRGAMADFAKG